MRRGVKIDTDIDVVLTEHSDIVYATVDGFEELDLRKAAQDGANVGFLYLRNVWDVPEGFYVMRIVVEHATKRQQTHGRQIR